MNQKESMMLHIRLDVETHKQVKHICVDKQMSIQDYIENLVKEDFKNESSP